MVQQTVQDTHIHTHNSFERGQGRVIVALIKLPQDKAVLRKFGHGKRPGARASTLMAFF